MKQTVTKSIFIESFARADRKDQFTREALECLFNAFEELEADTREEIEFNVVGICQEYSEMSLEEVRDDYSLETELSDAETLDWLSERTFIVGRAGDNVVFAKF